MIAIKRYYKVIAGSGLAVAVAVAFILLKSPQSTEDVAAKYRDCFLAGDGDCIASLTSSEELATTGMSAEDIGLFLREWVRPRYGQSVDKASFDVFGNGKSGFQIFTWQVMSSSGRKPLAVAVAQTDDGLRVVNGLAAVVISEMSRTPDNRPAGGLAKLQNWAKNARSLAPELSRYHFQRIRPTPDMEPMTLEEFARWCEGRFARAQAATPRS